MDNIEYIHVDAIPDNEYPLRILRAYRDQCNWVWSSSSTDLEENCILCKELNKAQGERAKILDKAIALLEKNNYGYDRNKDYSAR